MNLKCYSVVVCIPVSLALGAVVAVSPSRNVIQTDREPDRTAAGTVMAYAEMGSNSLMTLLVAVTNPNSTVYEIWTDSTGQYTTEARFLHLGAKTVELARPNGDRYSVPLSRLSQASQDRATQLAFANGSRQSSNNHAETEDDGTVVTTANPFDLQTADYLGIATVAALSGLLMSAVYYHNGRDEHRKFSWSKSAFLMTGEAVSWFAVQSYPHSFAKYLVVPEKLFSSVNRGCIAVKVALKFARFWFVGPRKLAKNATENSPSAV